MNADEFYKTVLGLWGEEWRPELRQLLEKNRMTYTRQTFWNWARGNTTVPGPVALALEKEVKRVGKVARKR